MKESDRYLSRRAASEWLGVCERTLKRLEDRGEIRRTQIARRVVFRESELMQFINKKTVTPLETSQ